MPIPLETQNSGFRLQEEWVSLAQLGLEQGSPRTQQRIHHWKFLGADWMHKTSISSAAQYVQEGGTRRPWALLPSLPTSWEMPRGDRLRNPAWSGQSRDRDASPSPGVQQLCWHLSICQQSRLLLLNAVLLLDVLQPGNNVKTYLQTGWQGYIST